LTHGKKIVYTTRTNAQQRQVILELRALRHQSNDQRIYGVGMQGRGNMCLLAHSDPELESGTSEELARYCTAKKKKAQAQKKDGCSFYATHLQQEHKVTDAISWAKEHLPTAEECITYCDQQILCPYELNKKLIKEAIVIVVPYIYIFDRNIRAMLFDWIGVADDDITLIVDEAHNLPDYLRDLFSARLSTYILKSCGYEAEKHGDPTLAGSSCTLSDFCLTFVEILSDMRDTYIYGLTEHSIRKELPGNNDAIIPSHEVETELKSRLGFTKEQLLDCISDLLAYGEKIQEYQQKRGKLPRSYIHKLGIFLDFWMHIEMHQYIKLVVDETQGKNPHIEAYCLDAAIGGAIIQEFHASLHMSGTLEPLEEYRDSIGLLKTTTQLHVFPSPFPLHHRRIYYVTDVTTRYEDLSKDHTILPRMWHYISSISNSLRRNTIVFLPSFNLLRQFQQQRDFNDLNHGVYIEEQKMSQTEIMQLVSDFKDCGEEGNSTGTFFSVIGGRISEGMDFPAEQLEIVLIAGIPYPKPTARQRALLHYYDLKFGKGWEYTVEAPTARKILQAIGRLIRDENDIGVAVILDKRAVRFRPFIPDLQESQGLLTDIRRFFRIYHKAIRPPNNINKQQ
ncbi:MAG: ATP-dependent DNA helicase, partial [Candidatus Thermoplasmatota archaeon]|nr:ATP-dependent DNA helicase [Candidatus Thermoplasmatota archaeon]